MRYRWRDQLKPWQVHQLHAADARATQLGLPLNTFMSIHWEATFPGSASMPSTFRRGMKRMGQWLRDRGTRFAFVYGHENPDDAKLNSHILVHVPADLRRAFKAKIADWMEASTMECGLSHATTRNGPPRASEHACNTWQRRGLHDVPTLWRFPRQGRSRTDPRGAGAV